MSLKRTSTSSLSSQSKSPNKSQVLSQSATECPICLQQVKVRGKLSCCNHLFCFACISAWSKVTNSCPLCKRVFHEIQKCSVNGKPIMDGNKPVVIPIEDHKQENDIIVQEFVYEDQRAINEYVEDDFLVGDDAPIIYDTQMTQPTQLTQSISINHDLQHLSTSGSSTIIVDSDSDSSIQYIQSYEHHHLIRERRQQRQTNSLNYAISSSSHHDNHRKRRIIIDSDEDDDSIIDIETPSLDASSLPDSIQQTPPLTSSRPLHSVHSPISSTITNTGNASPLQENSFPMTPILSSHSVQHSIAVTPTVLSLSPHQEPVTISNSPLTINSNINLNINDICADSYEDVSKRHPNLSSRTLFQTLSHIPLYPHAMTTSKKRDHFDSIIPETPHREKRSRGESERAIRRKMSRLM